MRLRGGSLLNLLKFQQHCLGGLESNDIMRRVFKVAQFAKILFGTVNDELGSG
jgi:hypothetical protein